MTDTPARHRKPWTERELAALRFHWESQPPRELRRMFGRSPIGLYNAARAAELGLGKPRGALSVTEAARQADMRIKVFKQVCEAAGVTIRPNRASRINPCIKRKVTRRERWLTPEALHKAVAWFCRSETITYAATRLGVSRSALDRLLRKREQVHLVGRSLRVNPEHADAAAREWLAEGGQRRGPKPKRAKVGGKV